MDYEGIRKRAAATIAKNGKAIKIILPGGTAYNPVTGAETAGADIVHNAKAVEISYSQAERDGTMVKLNDRRFIIAGLKTDGTALAQMATGHKIEVSTVKLEIITVMPLNPGEINVIYEVQARI
jgi:hypothetical protein